MAGLKWTEGELEYLTTLFPESPRDEILKALPGRTWGAVIIRASQDGIRRTINTRLRGEALSLLSDTPEAAYWAGFLMADGSVDHCHMRLRITLADKDIEHLKKLSSFLNHQTGPRPYKGQHTLSLQDKIFVGRFVRKYDFRPNKTENPPNTSLIKEEAVLPFFVGFVDGDGHVRKQLGRRGAILSVKVHGSWFLELTNLGDRVGKLLGCPAPKVKVDNSGYAVLRVSEHRTLRLLRMYVEEANLPVLRRKWELIDLSFITRTERAKEKGSEISSLFYSGVRVGEIAKRLKISPSSVCNYIRRNSLRKEAVSGTLLHL